MKASLWLAPSVGDLLYFDLDTVILGDITPLVTKRFTMLNDLGQALSTRRLQSGVMYLTEDSRELIRSRYNVTDMLRIRGDGQYLHKIVGADAARFQDLVPGAICSYKFDICKRWNGAIPPEVRVVCFHGTPRPHQVGWDPQRVWTSEFRVVDAANCDAGLGRYRVGLDGRRRWV
jgi:hypothetical protein